MRGQVKKSKDWKYLYTNVLVKDEQPDQTLKKIEQQTENPDMWILILALPLTSHLALGTHTTMNSLL